VLQEGEISADLFTFHEAVSQLQLLEEEVLDTHTSVAEMEPQWSELNHALLAMTNDVDYDQDGEFLVIIALKISFMILENVSD
jgi:kinesin family protein 2/24